MTKRDELIALDPAGLEAAVRECARITAPEVSDDEFARLKAEDGPKFRNTKNDMERMIRAYLAAISRIDIPGETAVKVKPLEWSATRDTGNGDVACDAISSIGHYIACNGGWFLLGQSTWFDTTDLDNAQAAAQADYESRIRSALDIEAQGVAVSVDELRSFIFSEGACTALDLARALLDKYSIRSAMTTEGRK